MIDTTKDAQLHVTIPKELKSDLKMKADKYHTDMTVLTTLILTHILKQL